MRERAIYHQLVRFLWPLALTAVVQGVGNQVLSGGMARVPRPTETLASFGLAWGLISFLVSPMLQVKQLALVLADGRHAYLKVRNSVMGLGLILSAVAAMLSLPSLGGWVIETVHGVGPILGKDVRLLLFWLSPIPVLRAMTLFYAGILLRIRRTDLVSFAILSSIAISILTVFGLLPSQWVRQQPIRLPVLATYAGILVELVIAFWGYRRYAWPRFADQAKALSYVYILRFFWPLALIMVIQGFSRPLINLFVSRAADGPQALAVLTVVYPLSLMIYGWVNEVRNLSPAFSIKEDNSAFILRFAVGSGFLSFAAMLLLFWTPLSNWILGQLIGLEPDLVVRARLPLIIASFLPLAVMLRAYLHGMGLLQHRTRAMAPSAPFRILAILAALIILPPLGLNGAARGIAALLTGFVVETVVVWWGIRRG